MKKTISILAISWAFLSTLFILIILIKSQQLVQQFSRLPFMKITPLYSGGDLSHIVEEDSLKIKINKPVFEALIGEAEAGFVQITFSGRKNVPQLIDQEIDYNRDKKADLKLKINTLENKTEFLSLNPNVKSLIVSSKVKNDWIVRIKVKKEKNK